MRAPRPTETSRRLVRSRSAASRSPAKTLGEVVLARHGRSVAPDIVERLPQRTQLERRDVDETRGRAGHALERAEQLVADPGDDPSGSAPARISSATKASRYTRDPRVTSAAAARIHRGEKPNAAIEPSSTAFPTPFLTARRPGSGSNSTSVGIGASTPPTSSIVTRSRFFAVAS